MALRIIEVGKPGSGKTYNIKKMMRLIKEDRAACLTFDDVGFEALPLSPDKGLAEPLPDASLTPSAGSGGERSRG